MNTISTSSQSNERVDNQAVVPSTPTRIVPPLPSPILIKGGIQIDEPPEFPLVAINKCDDIVNGYNLSITIVIPAGSINITLNTNFTETIDVLTEVGKSPLKVREITITYDVPDTTNGNPGYDIYLIKCTYQVGTNDQAQAVYIHYVYNDPVTTRGTITTVMTT